MVVYARICEAVNASGLAITTFLAWWRWLRPWRWTLVVVLVASVCCPPASPRFSFSSMSPLLR